MVGQVLVGTDRVRVLMLRAVNLGKREARKGGYILVAGIGRALERDLGIAVLAFIHERDGGKVACQRSRRGMRIFLDDIVKRLAGGLRTLRRAGEARRTGLRRRSRRTQG